MNKWIASILVVLLVTTSGMPALAESHGSKSGIESSVFNDELMRFLVNEFGEEQATSLFQTIRDLGLVDANGHFLDQLIYLKGNGYTLDEMKRILADENTDLGQAAEVDGASISLDVLKKIIAIEDYIEFIRQTMSTEDVKITPSHLDSLNSLIKQATNEGLVLNSPTLAIRDDYEDETYVTVTKYENLEEYKYPNDTVELTFELNKPQEKEVSFSYELMEGALKALPDQRTGTITFPRGVSKQTLRISAARLPSQNPYDYEINSSAPEYRHNVWARYARADYIHFYNFKNLDSIQFDLGMGNTAGRVSALSVFTHAYNGGAYLAYAPVKGTGDKPPYEGQVMPIFDFAANYKIFHSNQESLKILDVSTREGNYTTGQIVPYTVTFDKLVLHQMPDDVHTNLHRLELANGDIATPAIVTPSSHQLYKPSNIEEPILDGYGSLSFYRGYQTIIKKGMTPEDLNVLKATGEGNPAYYYYTSIGNDWSGWDGRPDAIYSDAEWEDEFFNQDNTISISYAKSDAFGSITLNKSSYSVGETATVTVQLENGDREAAWIIDGGKTSEEISKKLVVSIGNKEKGLIDLDWKKGEDGEPLFPLVLQGTFAITEDLFDLMSTSNRADGKLRAKIYYNRDLYNSGGIENFGLLADMFANFKVEAVKYIYPDDLSITYPDAWPSGVDNLVFLTDKVATRLGYTFPADATYHTPNQFAWSSNDQAVATITEDGIIYPKQEGIVKFTLTAKNNGMLTPTTEITSAPIEIRAGGPPEIVVPDFANKVYVQKNADAAILWLTNVMSSRYKELAGTGNTSANAHFTVELYEGDWKDTDLPSKTPIQTWSAPATQELINATSFIIPGTYIKDISNQHTPSYTVRISTQHPSNPGITLSALSYIVVKSAAAFITLDKSVGQYMTDSTRSIDLKWNLANFDSTNKGDFEFKVTKNGVLVPGSLITFDQAKGTFTDPKVSETGGAYTLTIDPVSANKQIKDVYAITLAAKNSLDSTWSFDSLYLQVYKSNALQIQIDGVSKTTHTMSNVETIKNMTNDQRVALNRNIILRNEMHINYKDYTDLGEITDQIQWKSSNDDAALVYFNSNGNIANIKQFNYSSYQPKNSFVLAGIESGKTTITATYAKTGMQSELDVTVNTLRDKLYLFQFYPKVPTKITYTDRKGEEKSMTSNANGELALYDEDGVGSDVYVTSTIGNTTYTGVISHETVLSKEKNVPTMELYPINILQLRQLSKVEVFFKTPDGNPYTGKVTYRGGVYKNGNYCEPTEIGGAGISKQLGTDGKLEVILDTTNFYSRAAGEKNAATLSARDQIELVFEFTFEEDKYYPQFMTINGNTNIADSVAFGDKISGLVKNTKSEKALFLASQIVADNTNNNKTSIMTYTGKFGPSNQFPNIKLTTEFIWWGEQVDEAAYAELYDEAGYKPQGQSHQTIKYPFTNTFITRHQQVLNKDTIWLEKGQSSSLYFKIYDARNEFRKGFISSASLLNMIGVKDIDVAEMYNLLSVLKETMNNSTDVVNPSAGDKIVGDALGMISRLGFESGPLTMKIIPTDDPSSFKTIIATSFGNMPSTGEGNSGGTSIDIQFLQNGKTSLVPGLSDLYRMNNNTYDELIKKEMNKVQQGKANGNGLFSLGGYYLGEIKYNNKTLKWEHLVIGGGFNAGGGYKYTQNFNQWLGPVPVTFSLTVAGGVEVGFKASVLNEQLAGLEWSNPRTSSVNDYLTSLRIIAYLEAFGGAGFDYSVVAAKIGVFGRITLENTTSWLSRDYLVNKDDRAKVGNKLTLEGIVGIKAVIKFLFFSDSYTFASLRYSHSWVFDHWNEIQAYWKKYAASPLTADNMDVAIASYMKYMGIEENYVFKSSTLEDRSYLAYGERRWNATDQTRVGLKSLDPENAAPKELQTNAYPYANPQVSNDGSLFVYMSDGNSTAIKDTAASWAKKIGNHYVDQGPIVTDLGFKGFGDSNLQIAGEGNQIAAVWVRQKEMIHKEAGEEISNTDILFMNNSAEIMAAVYDGEKWTAHRLTDNSNPDLAPVVSVNHGKVFVAYRSVYSSNTNNPLDFLESDSIVYTVYDMSKRAWSDVETLYNGTNGTVMGLSAATLSDGTAAVVYSVNKGITGQTLPEDYVAGSDNEIIYAVLDTDEDISAAASTWRTKGVVKNLQVTNDTNANENPQITSARFANADGTEVERYVIAWHTTGQEIGFAQHDIKLLAVNKDGEIYTGFVDSMNALQSYNDIKIHPNFTFVRMPNAVNKIENLSIMWKEAEVDYRPDGAVTRDVIKAVKFGIDDNQVFLSGAIDVATMPDFTEVDQVDAYISNSTGPQVKAFIIGTTYTTDANVVGTVKSGGEGEDIPIHVSKSISAMYTATETYANKFHTDEILFSPTEIVIGYDFPIQFNIVNQGMSKIESVTIRIDGQEKTVFNHVALEPNSGKGLIVPYTVPSLIKDVPYEVEVLFGDGEAGLTNGTLNLDIPDLGISNVQIMEEAGGKRVLFVPIYNKNDTTLANKGRVVKFGLYKDTIYTDEYLIGDVIEIKDQNDLSMIDQGGFTKKIEVHLQDYLTTLHLSEIPDNGISLYLHSWVENTNGDVAVEFNESNNDAKVWFENLALKYSKNDILLLLEQTNVASHTSVNLSMQNLNMAPISSGNVLLNLLDRNGNIIESKYVATNASQLLSFAAEEKKSQDVQFSQKGDAVQAMFFIESADKMDSTLSALTLSGAKMNFVNSQTDYRLQATDLKKTHIYAVATHSGSIITLLDRDGKVISSNKGFLSMDQTLKSSPDGVLNEFVLSVQPESASGTATNYNFAITNTSSTQPNLELMVKGTINQAGKYVKQASISLSPYDVNGFAIAKASYNLNDGPWTDIAYDGKTEQTLTTISKAGVYTIGAKVHLVSGMEYVVDPVTIEVIRVDEQNPSVPKPEMPDTPINVPTPESPNTKTNVFRPDIVHFETLARFIKEKLKASTADQLFSDVQKNWALASINKLVKLGAIKGYPDGSFKPAQAITRAEFASMIVRLFAIDDKGTIEAEFKDTHQHWAMDAIRTLARYGLVNGYEDGTFKPDATITREEIVVMIMRLLNVEALPQTGNIDFMDLSRAGNYARESIVAAAKAGIVTGYMDHTFKPKGQATRAEVATILIRLLALDPRLRELMEDSLREL